MARTADLRRSATHYYSTLKEPEFNRKGRLLVVRLLGYDDACLENYGQRFLAPSLRRALEAAVGKEV